MFPLTSPHFFLFRSQEKWVVNQSVKSVLVAQSVEHRTFNPNVAGSTPVEHILLAWWNRHTR